MTQEPTASSKRDCLADLLDKGMVQILIDSRCAGVTLPAHLEDNLELRLNLSYRFGLPIELDDWGVHASLTFTQVPHECKIPWKSIYAIIPYLTNEPILFPEDVPLEVVRAAETHKEAQTPSAAPAPVPAPQAALQQEAPPVERPRPSLSLVAPDDDASEEAADAAVEPAPKEAPDASPDDEPTESGPRSRAHLRVVK